MTFNTAPGLARPRIEGEDYAAHLVMRIGFFVFCFLYFGPRVPVPPIISMTGCGIFSIGLILSSRHCSLLAARCWPLFMMCALAAISALWSVDPSTTLRRSMQLLFACMLGVALVGRLGSVEAIRLVIRTMVFACFLSIVWVLVYPDSAIHQATDSAQTVHAGLWRGLFAHKVNLGIFAGLTLGLVLFYGPRTFYMPFMYVVALVCPTACIVGSGSATGVAVFLALAGVLKIIRVNATQSYEIRRKLLRTLVLVLALGLVLITSGLVNQFASLLGRSADLTGRSTYWPFVMDFLNHGSFLVGYGYAAGFRYVARLIADEAQLALSEAHNGYIEMLVMFGYLGGTIIIAIHLLLFWQAGKLLLRTPERAAKIAVFPLGFMVVLLLNAYIESVILAPAGIYAVLLPIAVAIRAQVVMHLQADDILARRSAAEAAARGETVVAMDERLRA